MFPGVTADISTIVAEALTWSKYRTWSEGEYLLFTVFILRCCCIFQNLKKMLKTIDGKIGQIMNNLEFPSLKP